MINTDEALRDQQRGNDVTERYDLIRRVQQFSSSFLSSSVLRDYISSASLCHVLRWCAELKSVTRISHPPERIYEIMRSRTFLVICLTYLPRDDFTWWWEQIINCRNKEVNENIQTNEKKNCSHSTVIIDHLSLHPVSRMLLLSLLQNGSTADLRPLLRFIKKKVLSLQDRGYNSYFWTSM